MKPIFSRMLTATEAVSSFLDCMPLLQPVYEECPFYSQIVSGNMAWLAAHIESCEICMASLIIKQELMKKALKNQQN